MKYHLAAMAPYDPNYGPLKDEINETKGKNEIIETKGKDEKVEDSVRSIKNEESVKKERSRILVGVSKELEISYMNKFLNKEVEFIPETYKDGFIYGHTGNYLSIKMIGNKGDLKSPKKCKIKELQYPYLIGER